MWVDAHWLTSASGLRSTPGGAFGQLDEMIEGELSRRLGLFAPSVPALVPVVAVDSSDDVLRKVALLREHHDRPVVVRVRDLTRPAGDLAGRIGRIGRIVDLTSVDPAQVHVVVDVGYVDAVTPPVVRDAVDTVRAAAGCGSVTLLAGSVPTKRTTYDTSTQDRPELELWQHVSRLVEPPVRYGDYGIAHPVVRPRTTSELRQPHPYLYYTVTGRRIALRRKPDRENVESTAASSFADLAGELVRLPDFAGHRYSWGDERLLGCKEGRVNAGASWQWIAMATSHHISHISREAA